MPLLIIALGVLLLFILMIGFRLNSFLSLILVSISVGLLEGMPLQKVLNSIKAGVSETLGHLLLIIGLGAIFGKLMADCGATQKITTNLLGRFNKAQAPWALALASFIIGIPLFYEVGFVVMVPLVFSL